MGNSVPGCFIGRLVNLWPQVAAATATEQPQPAGELRRSRSFVDCGSSKDESRVPLTSCTGVNARNIENNRNRRTDNPWKLPFEQIKLITNNFSEELGRGAFGQVFKGVREDGEEVAVKMLRFMGNIDDNHFENEFEILKRLEHPNIVRLVGFCDEAQDVCMEYNGKQTVCQRIHRALCLEYMPNGSLRKHLPGDNLDKNWQIRYRIIKGICEGLEYLQEGLEFPVFHLDLKPDNILLNKEMVPKITDFGLSRIIGEENTKKTLSPLGTIGYIPPEFIHYQVISKEYDIYSLGVIVTKIITGTTGYSVVADMGAQEFVEHVHENWRKCLQEIPRYDSLEVHCKQVKRCIEIARRCMENNRHKRPTIKDIVSQLDEIGWENYILDAPLRWEEKYSGLFKFSPRKKGEQSSEQSEEKNIPFGARLEEAIQIDGDYEPTPVYEIAHDSFDAEHELPSDGGTRENEESERHDTADDAQMESSVGVADNSIDILGTQSFDGTNNMAVEPTIASVDQNGKDSAAPAEEGVQPETSKQGRRQQNRRGRGKGGVKRTRSVRAVVEDAKTILGETFEEKNDGQGDTVKVGATRKRRFARAAISEQDEEGSEAHSESVSLGGQRRKRRQAAGAVTVAPGERRYNLRHSRVANAAATTAQADKKKSAKAGSKHKVDASADDTEGTSKVDEEPAPESKKAAFESADYGASQLHEFSQSQTIVPVFSEEVDDSPLSEEAPARGRLSLRLQPAVDMTAPGAPFLCNGCKEPGYGPRYKCDSGGGHTFDLHTRCARADDDPLSGLHTLVQPLFGYGKQSEFRFLHTQGARSVCDTCGEPTRGFVYHCSGQDVDLHPCCASLPDRIIQDGRAFGLHRRASRPCALCPDDESQRRWFWAYRGYVDDDEAVELHVACLKDMARRSWEACYRNQDDVGDGALNVDSMLENRFSSTFGDIAGTLASFITALVFGSSIVKM